MWMYAPDSCVMYGQETGPSVARPGPTAPGRVRGRFTACSRCRKAYNTLVFELNNAELVNTLGRRGKFVVLWSAKGSMLMSRGVVWGEEWAKQLATHVAHKFKEGQRDDKSLRQHGERSNILKRKELILM